jgi:hypothetical protein
LLFGLLFPTDVDPSATTAPAPPAVTYLSPLLPLVTIATNGPITNYGVRYAGGGGTIFQGGGVSCGSSATGIQTCQAIGPSGAVLGKPFYGNPPQPTGTAIPSGLFRGWQYWQATLTMQLTLCLIAILVGAVLLPPIRRLPWRRRVRAPAGA